MIRIAAIGDIHCSDRVSDTIQQAWKQIHSEADMLLIAGDLTTLGTPEQGAVLARALEHLNIPVVAVLGNHDYHADQAPEIRQELERRGVIVLQGESTTLKVGNETVGIAGTTGFGGGFAGACGSAFGEPEMKAFIHHSKQQAYRLRDELLHLPTDYRIALMHYAPVEQTLVGERLELYPFLGSHYLADAVDNGGADLVLHGHAHLGKEEGMTGSGVPVRNVALPVLRKAYMVYTVEHAQPAATPEAHPISIVERTTA